MLIFIAIWLALIAVTFPVGLAILRLMDAQCFERSGERFVISVWLGTVLLADGLLAVSLFQPLSLATGGLLAAVLVGAALVVKRVRSEIRTAVQALYLKMSPIWSLGFIALLATVAYVATSGVNLYDAHLYHFQVIQWLSQVGVVPGLALIHNRFSFTSSWFAIAAPFNTGILETRVSALTGGFALLLITLQVFISFTHLLESPKRSQDWFVVAAAFIYLPFLMHSTLVVSPSPDLPAIALIVLVAWTMLVTGGSPGEPGLIILSPRLIPVLLAAGAMAIKLSAAVLLPIAVLFYALEQRRLRLGSLITASLVGIILILPVLSFGLIASGCPLYPSPTLCQDLPWSVGREEAKMISGIIHIWPRWGGAAPRNRHCLELDFALAAESLKRHPANCSLAGCTGSSGHPAPAHSPPGVLLRGNGGAAGHCLCPLQFALSAVRAGILLRFAGPGDRPGSPPLPSYGHRPVGDGCCSLVLSERQPRRL